MTCRVLLTADTVREAAVWDVKLILSVLAALVPRASVAVTTGEDTGHCKYLPPVAYRPC